MLDFPKNLKNKLNQRVENNSLRSLKESFSGIDFSSNDYLGFAKSEKIFDKTHQFLIDNNLKQNGATGSRLISGNSSLYDDLETLLCKTHKSDAALVFNSGYDANLGFFSSVPQRNDIILYDEFIHASIRDGIQLSKAKSYKFKHNDLDSLKELLYKFKVELIEVYVVTESVFSMDGDSPELIEMVDLVAKHNAHLIVDEAHALGVFEYGLVQKLSLEDLVFARIITFGKALGCHGAAILGSTLLYKYLVNFSRSFIYTTGLSPHALATIKVAYKALELSESKEKLQNNIEFFKEEVKRLQLNFIESNSAIQCCIISRNKWIKEIAENIQKKGYNIKPILSPTVPLGKERLRFCLHSYNSKEEITNVLENLATFVAE